MKKYLATLTSLLFAASYAFPTLLINEIRVDQDGTDNDEFFELTGNSGESLTDVWYLVIGDGSGGSGVIESVAPLSGTVPTDGFFVVAETTFTLGTADLVFPDNPFPTPDAVNFENGDNVTHLLVTGFTGADGDDLDTDDDGVLNSTLPWTTVLDAVSILESDTSPPTGTEYAYGSTTALGGADVGPDGDGSSPEHIFRDRVTGDWNIGLDDLADPATLDTPGAANPSPSSNQTPVGVDDAATVLEGGTVSVLDDGATSVLANDTDTEGDALTVVSTVTGPAHGTLTLDADGQFTYTHDGSETTTDSFEYELGDAVVTDTDTVTVNITIIPVNDIPPVANLDNATLLEGGTVSVLDDGSTSVLANDTDADSGNDVLTVTSTGTFTGSTGTLTLASDGTFTYTHNGDETFFDTFDYVISDGMATATGSLDFNITPVNDPPVANDDTASVSEGGTTSYLTNGGQMAKNSITANSTNSVLDNDTDAEKDSLTVTSTGVIATTNGEVTLATNGTFTYEHDGSETTSDFFDYTVTDGNSSRLGRVNITVVPVSDAPPVANPESTATTEGGSTSVLDGGATSVLANDTDAPDNSVLSVINTGVNATDNGSVNLLANGEFTYTHDGSETTSDFFVYSITDGTDARAATVDITITPENDAPVANDDHVTVSEGGSVSVTDTGATSVLDNDIDDEEDDLTVTNPGVFDTLNGTVTLEADGEFTYTHDGTETTTDSFDYEITDGEFTATATVDIWITAVNEPPVGVDDHIVVLEGDYTDYLDTDDDSVLDNDTDPDLPADTLTVNVTPISGPSNGTLTLNANGTFNYAHDDSENLTDSFVYELSDGEFTTTATVEIWITPVNDNVPVANDDLATLTTGATLSSDNVLDNDTDVDLPNDTLTVDTVPVSGTANGTLTLGADGSFTYMHDGSATTTDSFEYAVRDAVYNSNTMPPFWETNFGAAQGLSDDDDTDDNITFGTFSFPFAGTTYTGNDVLNISSNGFVSLGGDNDDDCCSGDIDEFLEDTFARIAPFWTDLDPGDTGDVFLRTITDDDGDADIDRIVVTWDTELYGSGLLITVQLQLLEDGTIIMGYDDFELNSDDDNDALIGVSPGADAADPGSGDFTADSPFDSGTESTIYEFWEAASAPAVDIGQGANIIFEPNGSGGFDVSMDTVMATATVSIGIFDPINITEQPMDATITTNQSALLTAVTDATGDDITYQWFEGQSGDTDNPVDDSSELPILDLRDNVVDGMSATTFINGDDAMVLKKDGVIIDMIGVVGVDPAAGFWGSGDVTTSEDTLIRKSSVTSGDADGFVGNEDDLTGEWTGFPQNTFDDLGMHTADAATTDLFFSEYIEGSSNNKAFEIFNGTGAVVDLTDYVVESFNNGRTAAEGPTNTLNLIDLADDLADGAVLVVVNDSANGTVTIGTADAEFDTGALDETTSFWVQVSNGSITVDSGTATVTVLDVFSGVDIDGFPGWKASPWYKNYFAGFWPWIYHDEAGWQFVSSASLEEEIFVWDLGIGFWAFFNEDSWRHMYVFSQSPFFPEGWYFSFAGNTPELRFFQDLDGNIRSIPPAQ